MKQRIMIIILLGLTSTPITSFSCQKTNQEEESNSLIKETETTNMNEHDIKTIAQLTLDLVKLKKYYHIDVLPERSPLVIFNNTMIDMENIKLEKFGKGTVYVDKEGLKTYQDKAYFEFNSISIDNKKATIHFTYAIEGITGMVSFKKNNDTWVVFDSEIIER